jgi:hypothetical protein
VNSLEWRGIALAFGPHPVIIGKAALARPQSLA